MKLKKAATYFDRLVCTDAYGTATFKSQLNLFDDVRQDGLSSSRRILSVGPGVEFPARGVVKAGVEQWVIGRVFPDYFGSEVIRKKAIVQIADGLATLKTFDESLSGSQGASAYCAKTWIKGIKEIEKSSSITNDLNIYFNQVEVINVGTLITVGFETFIARSIHDSEAGFKAVVVDQLEPQPLQSAVFASRTYQPVSDTWAEVTKTIQVLVFRWESHFRYGAEGSVSFEHGDTQGVVKASDVTPKGGDTLVVSGVTSRVLTATREGTCWLLHLRSA